MGYDESSLSVPVSVAELQHLMMLTMSHYRSYLSMTGHLMMLTIGALVNKGVRPAHNDLICIGWGSMASILVCSCCRCSHQFGIKTPPSEVTPNIPTRSTHLSLHFPCVCWKSRKFGKYRSMRPIIIRGGTNSSLNGFHE